MKDKNVILLIVSLAILTFLYGYNTFDAQSSKDGIGNPEADSISSGTAYNFNFEGALSESVSAAKSNSRYWWLNSGGVLEVENGIAKTVQGDLSIVNSWREVYAKTNPEDTDGGTHPQNIFRLFTRGTWENLVEEVYFKINKDNLSRSPNRNISNGVFLISRFKDGDNTYYAGMRVDGTAIIKKKTDGVYYTLAQRTVWGGMDYDRRNSPSLLPKEEWLGIKCEVKSEPGGEVSLKLYLDLSESGGWILALEAKDDGISFGGESITGSGAGGIRSDFMDIEFKDFKIAKLE